jgi:hypothetical protein
MKICLVFLGLAFFLGCSSATVVAVPADPESPREIDARQSVASALEAYACPAGFNGALFVAEAPPPVSVEAGATFPALIRVANCTGQTWDATPAFAPTGYKLGFAAPRDAFTWSAARVALPENVPPNTLASVAYTAQAGAQPGVFPWAWSIVHESVAWLPGLSPMRSIGVRAVGAPACGSLGSVCCGSSSCDAPNTCSGGLCTKPINPYACAGASGAVFVSEIPPPASVRPGQPIQASVTFANCSGAPWVATAANAPTGTKLGFSAPRDAFTFGVSRLALPGPVNVNESVTIAIPAVAPAQIGSYTWGWSMLNESVAWFVTQSPSHVVQVEDVPQLVTLCPGVQADRKGILSASVEIQNCLNAIVPNGVLELPAGVYRMTSKVSLNRPLTFRTLGTNGVTQGCLEPGGPACAILRADENVKVPGGFVQLENTTNVTIDHVVIDGNRDRRLGSEAAQTCRTGDNQLGFNATNTLCTNCTFARSASINALCGTGLAWSADQGTIVRNVFRNNGRHTDQNLWADGLTFLKSNNSTVQQNVFEDNSDIDFICGGATNSNFSNNTIIHRAQAAFGGLMLDNFNGGTPGDFTGTTVQNNSIDCGNQQCDFGIELGPHPWYLSPNITGGTVIGNTIIGAKIQINCEGAGTQAQPMVVTQNQMGPSPSRAEFNCGKNKQATMFNISPDSFVQTGIGPVATGSFERHICP